MTKFGDLDAMDEDDWDKVKRPFLFIWAGLIEVAVLDGQCQEQSLLVQGGHNDIQCQSRRWSLHHHLLNCGKSQKDMNSFGIQQRV